MAEDAQYDDSDEDMMEVWKKLADDWKDHDHGVIAQVNCNSEHGYEICNHFGIEVSAVLYDQALPRSSQADKLPIFSRAAVRLASMIITSFPSKHFVITWPDWLETALTVSYDLD